MAMSIDLTDSKVANEIRLLDHLAGKIFSVFYEVSRIQAWILAWILILVFMLPIGLLYTLIIYLPVLYLRKKIKNTVNSVIKSIPQMTEEKAMELQAEFEHLRGILEKGASEGTRFIIFEPLLREFGKSAKHLRLAETELTKIAYPDYDAPLTDQEHKELWETMKPWREDEKESMEVY